MGDSHAALFAHAGWRPGQVKATFGTGSSVMGLGRCHRHWSPDGLCLTVAWEDEHGPAHAFEGNIRSSGAHPDLAGEPARSTTPAALADAGRASPATACTSSPRSAGSPRPWWDDEAVGLIVGLTFATAAPQLARAALESIAFQVEDVVAAIEAAHRPVSRRCSPTAARPATAR